MPCRSSIRRKLKVHGSSRTSSTGQEIGVHWASLRKVSSWMSIIFRADGFDLRRDGRSRIGPNPEAIGRPTVTIQAASLSSIPSGFQGRSIDAPGRVLSPDGREASSSSRRLRHSRSVRPIDPTRRHRIKGSPAPRESRRICPVALRSAPEGPGSRRPVEGVGVEADGPGHGLGGIVEELDPEVPGPRASSRGRYSAAVWGTALNRVFRQPTSALSGWSMPDPVAELDVVVVAGAAAVGLVGPGREEGAEDAMLHVEHRDLLVDHHLQPVRRDGAEQVVELLEAQVVGGRDPAAPPGLGRRRRPARWRRSARSRPRTGCPARRSTASPPALRTSRPSAPCLAR